MDFHWIQNLEKKIKFIRIKKYNTVGKKIKKLVINI